MSEPTEIVHVVAELGEFDAPLHMRNLAASQVRGGKQVAVVVFQADHQSRKELLDQGIDCLVVRRRWRADPFAAWQLVRELRRLRPRVVHLWEAATADFAAVLRWGVPEAKWIATLGEFSRYRNLAERRNNLALDTIVVEEPTSGDRRVTTIVPGIALEAGVAEPRGDILTEWKLPAEARIVGVAGLFARSQRLDEVLWNFELVRTLHEDACLVIVGEGPDQPRLERYAGQVSELGSIRFLPARENLTRILAQADIWWQVGESPTLPTALLSAMHLGKPIVATDTPAHRRAIAPDTSGYLAPVDKRGLWTRYTDEFLRNEFLRNEFGTAAQAHARDRFTLGTMLQQYAAIYGEGAVGY